MDTETKLITNDPVTCVRYCHNRFIKIMNLLKKSDGLFKEHFVIDSFLRVEFQTRGSVHIHALLYCNNTPIYDENDSDSEQKLIDFIDKLITCRKKTMILKPLNEDEVTGNEHVHMNKIKDLMNTYFNSNTDVIFQAMLQNLSMTEFEYINAIRILDAYVAAFYMVNYVTKIEAGLSKLLREASEDIENGNLDLKQKLRKIANVFINRNVLTAQEAVHHTLSLLLSISSRNVVYINTVPSNQRSRMLKKPKELKLLAKNSKDIQKVYTKCNEDDDNKDNNNENIDVDIKERKKRKIIRYYGYKIETDPINYFREHVLLFLPFTNEESEIEKANCEKLFYDNFSTIEKNKSEYCII
ncbi:hypothetical protein TSAR_010324 [Trichomalopsis sarcophagae]|uniref:Helitron helicase-like domain-containing protein n=1 Tax=Trichomalopsis sarcophagae TaxID=543379 RepID=A0A232EKU7_9HYME|nr:hypothetical protein TSAR_010324 [Trichomalopsis sarcophagae]